MSLYMLSMNMGQIIGPLLGGLLLDRNTIGVIFGIHSIMLAPYFLSVATLPDIEPASQERLGVGAGHGFSIRSGRPQDGSSTALVVECQVTRRGGVCRGSSQRAAWGSCWLLCAVVPGGSRRAVRSGL
ncbi:hypothetical protein [Devriesea agamarum]|uniref:hypothetical protein n=1 Tax=Devriesea agamarum TaxID=472569 RepID=UPI0038B2CB6F